MAQSKKSITKKPLDSIKSKFTKNIDQVQSFIDDLSVSVYGTTTNDESDLLNDRFNQIMDHEIDDITGNGANDYSQF